jgi:2-dehydro-3-deoxy-L-rhamnonate dehydrogenase (NAD+)
MNRIDLAGRVAIVTGAAKGIGRAIADRLSASGAMVVGWDLMPAPNMASEIVDVSSKLHVDQACARARAAHGRVDILVNNAGIAGPTLPVETYRLDDWERILRINLTGTFLCSRALVPLMRSHGYGRIVNIASLAGKEGTPNSAAYSASKAGVIALTKALGKELAGTGVLVNAIAPAAVETELLQQMTPEHVATMLGKSPLGRLGRAEEVAALAAWLASEECSFNTGAVFDLSGGRATY